MSEVTRVAGVIVEKGSGTGSPGVAYTANILNNLKISDLTTGNAINNSAQALANARGNNPSTTFTGGISNAVLDGVKSIGKFINPTSLPGFTDKMVASAWGKAGAQV